MHTCDSPQPNLKTRSLKKGALAALQQKATAIFQLGQTEVFGVAISKMQPETNPGMETFNSDQDTSH